MVALPAELYSQIFDFLPQSTVKECRLLSKHVGNTATTLAFRHIRLEAEEDTSRFVKVALSDTLRFFVREVTIDSRVGPSAVSTGGEPHQPWLSYRGERLSSWHKFLLALPLLRFFTGLKTVNLRFSEYCGNADPRDWRVDLRCRPHIDETYDHRFLVLDAVFHCLAGQWSEERRAVHDAIRNRLFATSGLEGVINLLAASIVPCAVEAQAPIAIDTLTVSNLADFDDERITSSEAFKQVLGSKSLRRLKLLIIKETDYYTPGLTPFFPEKYEFFEGLPNTWLSPPVAQNLRVLSLFRWDYWGWCPKMDFRCVNPGNGLDSGLPNLRVLALGKYIFSHVWQIDWLSSVGRQNGRGGLEELYLDDCAILWGARTISPLDESTTTLLSADGNSVEISNQDYPRKDIMISHPISQPNEHGEFDFHLKWKQVLNYWRENMAGLKVFKMGVGPWNGHLLMNLESARETFEGKGLNKDKCQSPTPLQTMRETTRRSYKAKGTVFLNYGCPSPPRGSISVPKLVWNPKYEYGVGLESESRHILKYIYFDIELVHTPWDNQRRRDSISDLDPDGYIVAQEGDRGAYDQLCNAVGERNST